MYCCWLAVLVSPHPELFYLGLNVTLREVLDVGQLQELPLQSIREDLGETCAHHLGDGMLACQYALAVSLAGWGIAEPPADLLPLPFEV